MNLRGLASALAAAALLWFGCAPPPPPGEPIGRDDLERLARALSAPGEAITCLRGSGGGEITVSGRGTAVSFAFVYSRPGWARVDVRPQLGAAGHALSSLSVLDDQCLRTYFPAEAVEVSGCLSDLAAEVPQIEPAALVLGVPRFDFLVDLEDARLGRDGDAVLLEGDLGRTRLKLRAEGAPLYVSRLGLELAPGGRALSLTYSGRGWHATGALPRTVEIAVLGDRLRGRVRLDFRRAQTIEHVAREDYELEVPAGTRSVTWGDLGFGRER